jgi:hypothetical protein
MSSPSTSPDAKARLVKILGLTALSDIAIGIVLLLVGLDQDNEPLTMGGIALAVVGLGVATWAGIQRGKPIQL